MVVEDTTGRVSEAWTGPQVAWKMARGGEGSFGGKTLLKPYVWLAFCLVFLVGLADLRRPLSMRNLDLLVLLGFTVSLAFFDRGEIFRSVPLVYPVLALSARPRSVGRLRPARAAARVRLADLGARCGGGLPPRVPRRTQSRDAARRHRRRARGSRRREQDPRRRGAVREHAAAWGPEPCGPKDADGAGARAHPDERALRGGDRARRHLRPGLVPRLRAGHRRLRLEREVGLAPGRARHLDRVRPARDPRAGPRRAPVRRSAAGRVARASAGRRTRSRRTR